MILAVIIFFVAAHAARVIIVMIKINVIALKTVLKIKSTEMQIMKIKLNKCAGCKNIFAHPYVKGKDYEWIIKCWFYTDKFYISAEGAVESWRIDSKKGRICDV